MLLYPFLVFVAGACAIAIYFFYKVSKLPTEAGLVSVALLPIAIVYIVGFGILCLFSLLLWKIFSHLF